LMAPPSRSFLKDPFGRPVDSLRLAVTQRCNFGCFFCHKEGEETRGPECSAGHIERIVKAASALGMRKVKLTGGEPLLRRDIVEIVSRIAPYSDEVSITTNGFLLDKYARELRECGLKRANVSFHSADPETFRKITGSDRLDQVKKGVTEAIHCGLAPLKLNMVVLKDINDKEILHMIEFSKEVGAILQLIEFEPIQAGSEPYWRNYHYDLQAVEDWLKALSFKTQVRELQLRRQYYLRNGAIVEVVRPMHNSGFCMHCTRLRVTSDGRLKPCLMRNDNLVDVLPILTQNVDDLALAEAFKEAITRRQPYWRA